MIPYLIIAFMPISISMFLSLTDIGIKEKKSITIYSGFITLFIFQCLRKAGAVGIDFDNYVLYFNEIKKLSFKQIFTYRSDEYGFWFLVKLISVFTSDTQVFISILSLITILPLAKFYKNNTELPIVTFSLFLAYDMFAMTFSGARQALAVSIIVISFKYVKEFSLKNIIKFYIGVLIACQFHASAIIAVVIYPMFWLKLGNKSLLLVVVSLILIYIFKVEIFTIVMRFLPNKYLKYFNIEQTSAVGMMIFDVAVLICSYLLSTNNEKVMPYRNMQLIVVLIRLFAPISYLATRFAYYFIPFSILVLPKVLETTLVFDDRALQFAKAIVCIGAILLMIYSLQNHDALGIYPYYFFWE